MLGLADKPLGLNKTCKKQKKPHRASFQVYKWDTYTKNVLYKAIHFLKNKTKDRLFQLTAERLLLSELMFYPAMSGNQTE